jgi:hypothetical protein
MFRALICLSSRGTLYTTIGILCAYYVGWLLAGLEWNSTPNPLAASRHNTHKIYQLLYTQCLMMMSKRGSKHLEATNRNKLIANNVCCWSCYTRTDEEEEINRWYQRCPLHVFMNQTQNLYN